MRRGNGWIVFLTDNLGGLNSTEMFYKIEFGSCFYFLVW